MAIRHLMKGVWYIKDREKGYLTESGKYMKRPLFLQVKFFSTYQEASTHI